jgi:hypothetical protein
LTNGFPLRTNQIFPQTPPFRTNFSITVILAWRCHFLTSFPRRMALSIAFVLVCRFPSSSLETQTLGKLDFEAIPSLNITRLSQA